MESLPAVITWPTLEAINRLLMALGVGLFVGLEREWRGKEAGLRTFGFSALFCGLGGMLGQSYAIVCVALLGVLICFLNWNSIRANQGAELTTSAALMVTGLSGVACGLGHTTTPVAIAVITAGLLAWKEHMAIFSHELSAEELRSAILLAILTFVIFPILPTKAMDPWGFFIPQEAWLTVILVASIGFVNYILWKIFGENGIELTGFLGGLVNSTVAVSELASRVHDRKGNLSEVSYRGVLLATSAMALRNTLILGILAPVALKSSIIPLFLILIPCAVLVIMSRKANGLSENLGTSLPLHSPFSIYAALKLGTLLLLFQLLGTVAQDFFGHLGFYSVSIIGGLVSSASAVASAGNLLGHGKISPHIAGVGAVLASLASAGANVGLVFQLSKERTLKTRLGWALSFVIILAILGAILQPDLSSKLKGH